MILRFRQGIFYFLSALCLWSCGNDNQFTDSNVIARVGETYLYSDDISGIVSEGVTTDDSIAIIKSYVNSWVKEQLILQKAKINLTEEQQNFERQLQNYKNSLLTYAFEEKLIEQKLDTSISETDIEIYYANNKDNFELKEDIVQFKYIKVPSNAPNFDKLKEWFTNSSEDNEELLNEYCVQFAEKCSFDTSLWVSFKTLAKELPIGIENPSEFMQNRELMVLEDSMYKHLLRIFDHKIKSSTSPKEFVKDKIRAIILKQRRILLLNEIKKEIFEEGTINKRYDIYLPEQ